MMSCGREGGRPGDEATPLVAEVGEKLPQCGLTRIRTRRPRLDGRTKLEDRLSWSPTSSGCLRRPPPRP